MQYYILFSLLIILALIEQFKLKYTQVKPLFIFIVFILLIFSGTRYDFGRDYYIYKDAFYNLTLHNYSEYLFEPLFALLCVLLRDLGFNFFIFTIALINISFKSSLIYKLSPYPLFSLLIYFSLSVILYEMGQMRQALAMILAFYAFRSCEQRNLKSFLCYVTLAVGFHYSAFILYPCYWFCNLHISNKKLLVFTFVLLGLSCIDLSAILLSIASKINITHISLKITEYAGRNMSLGLNTSLILRIIIFWGGILAIGNDKQYYNIMLLYLYGIILYVIFNSAPEIAMRSASYFKLLEIFIYPIILSKYKILSNRIIFFTLISIYLYYTMAALFTDHPDAFLPYKSFLI